MAKAVGIDLGTTNSVIAVWEGGEPTVIANAEGSRTTPSVVAFTDSGERLVGQLARRQAILNPKGTIYSAKRFIGRRYDEVERARSRRSASTSSPGPDGAARFDVRGKQYAPEEISALVLRKLAEDACEVPRREGHRGGHHRPGVLQRRAAAPRPRTPGASPASRCCASSTSRPPPPWRTGWTRRSTRPCWCSTSAAEPSTSASSTSATASSRSARPPATPTSAATTSTADSSTTWPTSSRRDNGIDLRSDPQALQRLFEAAEKAKIELSSVTQTQVNLPFITADAAGPKHLTTTIMRSTFEQITADLIERCLGPVKQAMADAKVTPDDIDEVILVGGSTRIPAVQNLVRRLTGGKDPNMTRQPGRGRRARRRDPGRGAQGRGPGRAAARRHAAVAGRRDPRRRDDQGHRAEHHHPGPAHRDVLAPPRTTSPRSTSWCCRASANGRRTTGCSAGSG